MDHFGSVLSEREQERRARMQMLDGIREPSPQPIFGEPVKILEDETSRRIKNTLGDVTQVLVNDPKLIGISRTNPAAQLANGHPSNGYVAGHPPGSYMVSGHLTTGHPGHQMTGYVSAGSSGYSSHGSSGYSSAHSGYSSTHSSSSMGSSSSYSRTQAALKKPPFSVMAKPTMPGYAVPKPPDKRSKNPLQPNFNVSYSGMKPSHLSGVPQHQPQLPYQLYPVQDVRIRDAAPWDGSKDQRRVNSTPVTATNASVESYVNNMNVVNNANNGLSTSAPIWNCGPETQAIPTTPFHLPSSATPSVPCKEAAKHSQIPTSIIPPATTPAAKVDSATPAKRNNGRPSNLKIQPERKTSTDAPIAVETILKQMTDVVPPAPLTGIQTPRKEETGFAFTSEPKEVDSFLKDNTTKGVPSSSFENLTKLTIEIITLDSPPAKLSAGPSAAACPGAAAAGPFAGARATPGGGGPVEPEKSVSLQDDLAVSDSEDEVILELKSSTEKCIKSPLQDSKNSIVKNSDLGINNNNMEENSAESSNSSSSEDSDSDDSSSETNESDSSSEASDEEVSSKKWGLSNFVESQTIYSPAFNPPEAVKEASSIDVENSNLNNVNPSNGKMANNQAVKDTATFLVPEVPVAAKNEILSPIPSPVHTQIGPRTPPSPPCLKQESSDRNKTDNDVLVSDDIEHQSCEALKPPNKSVAQPDKPQDKCDISADKGNVQTDKNKKQLRSSKSKEINSLSELSLTNVSHETNNLKDPPGNILEKSKTDKTSNSVITGVSEPNSENYAIKTRQRVSVTRRKSAADNISEISQKPEINSAIAKLKHPRACRKSTEKQINKPTTLSTSAKPKASKESAKYMKQEENEVTNVTEKVNTNAKHAINVTSKPTLSKISARSKGKNSKTPPKYLLDDKQREIKKKKKKFAIKNFVQSPEKDSKISKVVSTRTPSPERSPIKDCQKGLETSPEVALSTSKSSSKPNTKSRIKAKKVQKLRRSVRCSERASSNTLMDFSVNEETTYKETKKNSKISGKVKIDESLPISVNPPMEVLSPIPHEPINFTQDSDSTIPAKIMVCIPLTMLSRYPSSSGKQAVKNTLSNEDTNGVKTDSLEKLEKSAALKRNTQLKDKTKSSATKIEPYTKISKIKNREIKVESDLFKVKSSSNKNIKHKDKTAAIDSDKLSKKRRNDDDRKVTAKKPKLSSRSAEDKKSKEQNSIKTSSTTADDTHKSKTLERCDSTGSLSSLSSQHSQKNSKLLKDKKNDPSGVPDSKRIKTSASPLLSVKDIKQEKPEKTKIYNIDKSTSNDKKLKCKEKLGLTSVAEQKWDVSEYNFGNSKEDTKEKILASNDSLTESANRGLAEWDFPPDMYKDIKVEASLNKHNTQALVMPMDYYYTEGQKQRLLAEKEKDPFQKAVKCIEATVLFILTCQQREEYSKEPDSVYQFYSATLKFSNKILDNVKVLQTCPGSTDFKLLILILKCQSLLSVKLYNLKIKEIKEQLDGVSEFLQLQCPSATNPLKLQPHQSRFSSFFNFQSPHSTIPSPASNSQSSGDRSQSVGVPQNILDTICRQHTHLINLHRGHDLWEQADMYMTRSNLREFFKEVAEQSEPLTLHSSITELVKYIQKGLTLVKKSLR